MRDRFATGNGLDSTGNSNTGEGLEKYGSARIAGFSPSMKLILNILENLGPLTQKEITRVTRLPTRTVRYALSRLKEEILEEREYFQEPGSAYIRLNAKSFTNLLQKSFR